MRPKVLLAITPHPDDESLMFGGTLAKYGQDEDVKTNLITVTRGQKGSLGPRYLGVTRKKLGEKREQELRCAAKILKIDHLYILDYQDGEVPAVEENIAVASLIRLIRKINPQVVITFGPDGGYGHPDHIAVCHWVTEAVRFIKGVEKLYYYAIKKDFATSFIKYFGKIPLNGELLEIAIHDAAYIDATLDCRQFTEQKFKAIHCHQTQEFDTKRFDLLRRLNVKSMISDDNYHLAFARGNFPTPETDLFAGI
ncbi:MAG: PIG-L family deacetylase [Candidatus Chisholmbacteria bacterium]|nr:PIG-L family deacetylase [Candidatus Chisholmbacteria bacterium]